MNWGSYKEDLLLPDQSSRSELVDQSPGAAVTGDHELGDMKQWKWVLTVLEPRSLKSRCQQEPGAVAHTCHPSTLGGQGRMITCAQELETSLGTLQNRDSINNKKLARCNGSCL